MFPLIILEFFEKHKCPDTAFFLQSSSCVANEQLYWRTTALSGLFHFFYFMFTAPISLRLCFPVSPSLLFLMFFLKPLSSVVEKLFYTYI